MCCIKRRFDDDDEIHVCLNKLKQLIMKICILRSLSVGFCVCTACTTSSVYPQHSDDAGYHPSIHLSIHTPISHPTNTQIAVSQRRYFDATTLSVCLGRETLVLCCSAFIIRWFSASEALPLTDESKFGGWNLTF